MENNNDPSTGSGANKNQNVKELSDEQLKEVAGGGGETYFIECQKDPHYCDDKDCECHGFGFNPPPNGGNDVYVILQ